LASRAPSGGVARRRLRDDLGVDASLKGRLLVASPALRDPNFDRTIVLVLEHTDDGALGLVLNRPSETELAEMLPAWGGVAAEPGVVFVGGPVSPGSAIGLAVAQAGDDGDGFVPVVGPLGTVDLTRDPDDVRPDVRAVRVFAGYAGWAGGQLEQELDAGGWFVVDADGFADALAEDPEHLWRTVLRRQRGPLAWLAHFPEDPETN
jgi:putative transcriptional regulator